MKKVDIFCSSQAATSICLSMEQVSSSPSPSTTTLLGGGGGRVIDRHNPILRDSKRSTTTPKPPTPKPQNPHPKPKKNPKIPNENENHPKKTDSSAAAAVVKRRWSCTNPGEFLSPPGSTRYLLREKVEYNSVSSDSDIAAKICGDEETPNKETPPPPPPLEQEEVEVVMRVSLHCRGCEKKLRKHLSRMEGVKSFDIDFPAKKVTVAGTVTASEVVSTVSKLMKNAQLWNPSSILV